MNLPKDKNRVDHQYIDGTPKGYALRILKHYRKMCDIRYKADGVFEDEGKFWTMANEIQAERAKELDRAIEILKKGG